VSPQLLTICIALGAAAIALWVHARFPKLAPESLKLRFFLHVAGCAIVLNVAVPTTLRATAAADSVPASLLGLFGVAFPALVYTFLVTVWMLKLVQNAAGSSVR
jgi:hypothetical protein